MFFRIFTVLAVAALVIITWISSSPSHRPSAQGGAKQADLPGYYLKNAILTDYDASGAPSVRIEAERIDQIDHGNEVALYNVRVNYDAPGGQTWVLYGDTAHVQPGGKIIDVAGNVRLQGENPGTPGAAVVRTDLLSYNVSDSVASTKSDVRIDYGGHILTARGLSANLKERTMRLESRVNGRFLP
ncbi:MAG TPA: LPS export ABC transporter periplasmic protein LptC [Steroidobacteraceae bacterium]|jgi:lipopolysaccharide export system protein LptC|nr:LPS export ABC transporter periplasmic protein LptC [Steroidobacteraceae bacterium]